jgi:hypothetical protein
MKKLVLIFVATSVVVLAALVTGLYWLVNEGDLTDPDVVEERFTKQADNFFPMDIDPESLVGQEVVFTRARPWYSHNSNFSEELKLESVRSMLEYREILNPNGIASDTRYFRQGEFCEMFEGGKLAAKSSVYQNLLVVYTQTNTPRKLQVDNNVLSLSRLEGYHAEAWEECPSGTLVLVDARQYQNLRREWYLRKHMHPIVDELKRSKREAEEKLLRERNVQREKELQEAIDKALQSK